MMRKCVAVAALALLLSANATGAPLPVLQRGYDAGASGATLSETTLNTSNVTSTTFGLVFKLPVDDNIMAQPLYVPGVVINGVCHNVLYVATMSDTLYAFDADAGSAPLWTSNLATFGSTSGGTAVTLTGMNFVSGATVSFGSTAASSVVVVSATQITANTPPHKPGGANIVLTNPNGQTATLASGFTYHKH